MEECGICYGKEDILRFKCGHSYHKVCFKKWCLSKKELQTQDLNGKEFRICMFTKNFDYNNKLNSCKGSFTLDELNPNTFSICGVSRCCLCTQELSLKDISNIDAGVVFNKYNWIYSIKSGNLEYVKYLYKFDNEIKRNWFSSLFNDYSLKRAKEFCISQKRMDIYHFLKNPKRN